MHFCNNFLAARSVSLASCASQGIGVVRCSSPDNVYTPRKWGPLYIADSLVRCCHSKPARGSAEQ